MLRQTGWRKEGQVPAAVAAHPNANFERCCHGAWELVRPLKVKIVRKTVEK